MDAPVYAMRRERLADGHREVLGRTDAAGMVDAFMAWLLDPAGTDRFVVVLIHEDAADLWLDVLHPRSPAVATMPIGRARCLTCGGSIVKFGHPWEGRTALACIGGGGEPGCGWATPFLDSEDEPLLDAAVTMLRRIALAGQPAREYAMGMN